MTPAPHRQALLIRPCGRRAGSSWLGSDYRLRPYSIRSQSGTLSSPAISPSPSVFGSSSPLTCPTNITQLRPGRARCVALARQPFGVAPRIWSLHVGLRLHLQHLDRSREDGWVSRYCPAPRRHCAMHSSGSMPASIATTRSQLWARAASAPHRGSTRAAERKPCMCPARRIASSCSGQREVYVRLRQSREMKPHTSPPARPPRLSYPKALRHFYFRKDAWNSQSIRMRRCLTIMRRRIDCRSQKRVEAAARG